MLADRILSSHPLFFCAVYNPTALPFLLVMHQISALFSPVRNRVFALLLLIQCQLAVAQQNTFAWPDGKRVAISLSFDDARESQATTGIPLLNRYGAKATFYVVPAAVKKQLPGWKAAVASGQEIGNHSINHPCTGNFTWSRTKALED